MPWLERAKVLRTSFTPAAPVTHNELFAGRVRQLFRLQESFESAGEHAAIFGERGVGKTSLATVSESMAAIGGRAAVRVNCRFNDTIEDIWASIGEALLRKFRVDQHGEGRLASLSDVVEPARKLLMLSTVTSQEVLTAFEMVSSRMHLVIYLDEFDRIGDSNVTTHLVDVMKSISDQGLSVTLVVVGVAADVDSLIDKHESIGRGLNEIEMPRMSLPELTDIVNRGLAQAHMTADKDAS